MATIKVDFTDVKDGGAGASVSPGNYILKSKKVTREKASTGNTMVVIESAIIKPKADGIMYDRCVITPKALWRLRNLMLAMGLKAPKKVQTIDLNNLKNKTFGATIDDEEYEEKIRSTIVEVWPVGEREVGAKSTKSKVKAKAKKKVVEEDDEDDEDEDDDEDEEDDEEEDDDEDEDEDDDDDLEDIDDL